MEKDSPSEASYPHLLEIPSHDLLQKEVNKGILQEPFWSLGLGGWVGFIGDESVIVRMRSEIELELLCLLNVGAFL